MLNSTSNDILRNLLVDFINLLLRSELPLEVREILYGGRLIELQKKDVDIRPIAVSYTLRRLAAKCANIVINRSSEELQPVQVGVGVSGGTEAAIYATRRLLSRLPDNHIFVKLDFSNAFNSMRRNTILTSMADKMTDLYQFVYNSFACNPKLTYGDDVIIST